MTKFTPNYRLASPIQSCYLVTMQHCQNCGFTQALTGLTYWFISYYTHNSLDNKAFPSLGWNMVIIWLCCDATWSFKNWDQNLLRARHSEGRSLTRQSRFLLDTEVGNSPAKLQYLLMPTNRQCLSKTCHLKYHGSHITLSHWICVKSAAFWFSDLTPKAEFSLMIDTLSHCWPQPTSLNIQIFNSDAACCLKKDHKILNTKMPPESKAILP